MGYVEELRKLIGHRPLILVGSLVILLDDTGRLLLQKRKEPQDSWGLPGGLMEPGESAEDAARREVKEEMNLEIGDLQLFDVFSGPEFYVKLSNKDEFYSVTVTYFTQDFHGTIKPDTDEVLECCFFNLHDLPDGVVGSHKIILEKFFKENYSGLLE